MGKTEINAFTFRHFSIYYRLLFYILGPELMPWQNHLAVPEFKYPGH